MKNARKRWGLEALMAVVLLTSLCGCVDFEQEGTAFCQRNPQSCEQSTLPDATGTVPTIVQSSQSATQALASDTVTFSVTAQDEETDQLEFAWTSTRGTLGVPSNTGTSSQVSWTPPPCSPAGTVVTVSVTVSKRDILSTSKDFTLSTNPCPAPTFATAGGHALTLRGDGTVWAWGSNYSGQLGDGTTTERSVPVKVSGLHSVIAIATGEASSLALRSDGTVWAWGDNSSGQLGDGTTTRRNTPVQVSGLTGVTAMTIHSSSFATWSLALRNDGTVWGWGDNSSGQLGDGTTTGHNTPVQVPGLTGVTTMTTGSMRYDAWSLALRNDGTVWGWGSNFDGQLGDGTTTRRNTPVQVSGLTGVTTMTTGSSTYRGAWSLALRNDGTVWGWGSNSYGQLGDGTNIGHNTPVQVSGLTGVAAITTSSSDYATWSLVLRNDGTVWAWGSNSYGQLGDGTTTHRNTPVQVSGLADITAIAVGDEYSLALRGDGTVWAWGDNGSGQLGRGVTRRRSTPAQVSSLTGVISLGGGRGHSLALRNDGTVWAWGANSSGQLGDGTDITQFTPVQVSSATRIISLAASDSHSLALRNDGTVWAWGANSSGQLGDGTSNFRPTAVQVSSLTNILSIATGGSSSLGSGSGYYSLALRTDGTLWAWGNNSFGQFGDGTTTGRLSPAQVPGLLNVTSISVGDAHSLALLRDGTVWAWGVNSSGQLGDGTTTTRSTPAPVTGLSGVISIAAGRYHSLALRSDGSVWAWGANDSGQLGNGTTISRYTPVQVAGLTHVASVSASGSHSLALRNDGTVWAWGSNKFGQLGDGTTTDSLTPVQVPGLTSVTSLVAAGDGSNYSHSLALRGDGTVWAWGANDFGQLGDGTGSYSPVPVKALLP